MIVQAARDDDAVLALVDYWHGDGWQITELAMALVDKIRADQDRKTRHDVAMDIEDASIRGSGGFLHTTIYRDRILRIVRESHD